MSYLFAIDPAAAPPDLIGWAALITAITTPITLAIVNTTRKKVTQIDRAVNGQPPGTAPMVNQVQDLHAQIPLPLDPSAVAAADLHTLVRRLVVLAEAEAANKTPPPDIPPPAEASRLS